MFDRIRHFCRVAPAVIAATVLFAGVDTAGYAASGPFSKVTLRMNHGIDGQSYEGRTMELFAKRVGELTGGQVTIQVFHAAALGDDEQALGQVQAGTLDMEVTDLYANADTAGKVFELPFLFPDEATWVKAVNGPPGQLVADAAKGKGFHVLGYWMGGWREVYGNKPVNNIDDFKGLKIRTIQVDSFVQLFRAIGAIPTPIAFAEVYLALSQGTVDAAETDLQSMYSAKQYEVTKYVAITNHGLSTSGLIISEQRWAALPQNVKEVLEQVEKEAFEYNLKEYDAGNEQVQATLQQKGMTISHPDTTKIRAIGKELYPKLVPDELQRKVLDGVLALTK
jgi:tripartite ATP-independent transporter DctP family solute receptor